MSLSELCTNYISKDHDSSKILDKDILEFSTASWGLGLGATSDVPPFYPAQRFIIKCYYGLPLDKSSNRDIIINDRFNEKELYRFNEKEYLKYLYEEGRVNREAFDKPYPNMVLVIGRRGGKCVTGDTLVLTDKGVFRIDELGKAKEDCTSPVDIGVTQEEGRRSKASAFYNGGVKHTFRLKTKSGYNITGTGNHRVKVMSDTGVVLWKYLDEIKSGDFIGLNRNSDLWSKKEVNLKPYFNDRGRKDVSFPKVFDERMGNLFGYLVGDGSWTNKTSVSVTVEYKETWDHVKSLFTDVMGGFSVHKDKRTENTGGVDFHSVSYRKFFNDLGWVIDSKADTKRVPWVIFRSPKKVVCSFLRGLFEADGCAESGGRHITLSSASFDLAHEVQVLLLNLGIVSNVGKKWDKKTKKHYADLSIKGVRSRKVFSKLIGFDTKKKNNKVLDALKKSKEGKSNTESIPNQYSSIRAWLDSVPKAKKGEGFKKSLLRDSLGNTHKKSSGEDLSYSRLINSLEVAKKVGAGIEETLHFENLLKKDYFYDPVESIDLSEDQVYDLVVPDGVSFVANGMTNHNTLITSCIIAYETYRLLNKYSPQEYYKIMPDNTIKIVCVSTGKDTASELFDMVTGHIERSEFFRKFRSKPTSERMVLRTQRDLDKYGPKGRATVQIQVAPCSAKGLRGRNNIIVGLDEMAFFFADEKTGRKNKGAGGDRNDTTIYNAVTPSVAKFKSRNDDTPEGKIICISSPGPKSGKFYEEYERSYEEDNEDLFIMQAPTWEIDPNLSTAYLKQKYKENPIVFRSEFGAEFSDRLIGWIDDPEIIRKNIVPGLKYKPTDMQRIPHFMGIDVGLKNDGTAITIGHWVREVVDEVTVEKFEIDVCDVRYASIEDKEYFTPDEIAEWINSYTKKFYIAKGLTDQYYGMSIIPLLHKMGSKQFEYRQFGDALNSQTYQTFLTSMISSELRLPEGEPVREKDVINKDSELVREILTLQAEQKSKYIIKVTAPERKGMHDDMSDSCARAVFLGYECRDNGFGSVSGLRGGEKIRSIRMYNRTERNKASLNRPSSRYQSMLANRSGRGSMGSSLGSSFR